MSQNENILKHLKQGGKITALQAYFNFGCLRLAARIQDLEYKGHKIERETVEKDGKRFARYWMETK